MKDNQQSASSGESFVVGDQKVCIASVLYFGIHQCKLFETPTTAGKICFIRGSFQLRSSFFYDKSYYYEINSY